MGIYFITLFGTVLLAWCAERCRIRQADLQKGRPDWVWVLLLIVFLTAISGLRYMNYLHSDENYYRYMVADAMGMPIDRTQLGLGKEGLFYLLVWVSANVFGSDQALIFLSALITNVLVVCFFARYAKPFWFAMFLYITSGAFVASMNVLRQYIAVAIILWCYPLARKGKFRPYLALVAISAWFHQSAWVMLPVYFVLRRQRFNVWTILIVAVASIVFINFETVMTVILPAANYDQYLDSILSNKYGVKWIRILAWLVPYLVILICARRFREYLDIGYEVLYAVLLAACISVISSQYVFVARIESYFSMIAFLPIIRIPELFVKRDMRTVRIVMLVLFFAFGLYQYLLNPEYHNILFEDISGAL